MAYSEVCYHIDLIKGKKHLTNFFSLVSFFEKKTYKMGSRCVSVCVCVCVCVSVCVQFWSPPNNFQTSYPTDTKFWLHRVSYRNSPTPLISFLNFENCARENFLKFIFSPWGNFQTHIMPLIHYLDHWNLVYR